MLDCQSHVWIVGKETDHRDRSAFPIAMLWGKVVDSLRCQAKVFNGDASAIDSKLKSRCAHVQGLTLKLSRIVQRVGPGGKLYLPPGPARGAMSA